MKRLIFTLAVCFVFAAAGMGGPAPAEGDRVVVLVRHAEKAAEPGSDPELSEAGKARARALASALEDADIDAIVTTQFKRTRDTAAPVAKVRGLTPIVVPAGGNTAEHAGRVARAVRALPAGSVILVVGHSNTVPAIISALGGPEIPELCESEYAGLFVVVAGGGGPARLIRSRYGAPDPPSAVPCNQNMRQK